MLTTRGTAASLFSVDTALSDTARDLRTSVQSAFDPPNTSRFVRRTRSRDDLFRRALAFLNDPSTDTAASSRLIHSLFWAEDLIESLLPTRTDPDVSVDADGEVLFEWLAGPRHVVTLSVGPNGIINFASLLGGNRFHGVTRVGSPFPEPLAACLAQVEACFPADQVAA